MLQFQILVSFMVLTVFIVISVVVVIVAFVFNLIKGLYDTLVLSLLPFAPNTISLGVIKEARSTNASSTAATETTKNRVSIPTKNVYNLCINLLLTHPAVERKEKLELGKYNKKLANTNLLIFSGHLLCRPLIFLIRHQYKEINFQCHVLRITSLYWIINMGEKLYLFLFFTQNQLSYPYPCQYIYLSSSYMTVR